MGLKHLGRACTVGLTLTLLAGCGGGSTDGGDSAQSAHTFSGGASNVVEVTVGNGPSGTGIQAAFNIPYTSVTVCLQGTNSCATIDDVLVDTGSNGLRMIKSVLAAGGVSLAPLDDPSNPANTIAECLPFADGYAWGAVARATVRIGGETAASVPIEVIDDDPAPAPAAPSSCSSNGSALASVNAFDANGVLGIGQFVQDCGPACAVSATNNVYYSCDAAGSCAPTTLPQSDQVANPVASFATDNNGVILQLRTVAADGAPTSSGFLVFGIGTENNNGLQDATVITTNAQGDFTTVYNGSRLSAFMDSGSNALFFPDSSIPLCGQSGGEASFYCPSATLTLSALHQGADGGSSTVSFQVANIKNINGTHFAINDVAGPATGVTGIGKNYFDWGLPFFYGKTVFVAIEGTLAGGRVGPYYAY